CPSGSSACPQTHYLPVPSRRRRRSGTMSDVAVLLAALAFVSGFHGMVTKGPIVPVCRAVEPCSAPVQVTLVFHRAVYPYRVLSGRDGRYRIVLAPGYYTVTTLERIGVGRSITPRAVHVRRAHVDRLDFSIDTGIRYAHSAGACNSSNADYDEFWVFVSSHEGERKTWASSECCSPTTIP